MASRSKVTNPVTQLIECVGTKRKLIAVIGDVMVDRWVFGHTAPSQDRCAKFVEHCAYDAPGGAGNAARSIGAWPVHVELCGHWTGSIGMKVRFVEDGHILFRHDHDVVVGEDHAIARNQAIEWANAADAVLLSDYDKGFLTTELIGKITDVCQRRGIPCVADAKREPCIYTGCITKANEDWYIKHGIASVVTRGALRPSVSGVVVGPDLPPVSCVNHVGAGDCFAAHLAMALAYDMSLEDAASVAHCAGRVYVQHSFARLPYPPEIEADFVSAM